MGAVNMNRFGARPWLGFSAAALVLSGTLARAAVPQKINFQGRLTDSSGNSLTGTYSIQFSLWDSLTTGTQRGI